MSSSSIRKHAGTGAASDQPTIPEPSFAERARTLVYMARIGSVSTLSRRPPGFPFGSVMPFWAEEGPSLPGCTRRELCLFGGLLQLQWSGDEQGIVEAGLGG